MIQTPGKKQKRSGAGLIDWVSSDQKHNGFFRAVLTQLFEPTPSPQVPKISVVIDHDRLHFGQPVLAFLQAHQDRIELVCLPTSSPKLNPVERFWKHLRPKVTHNTFFQTLEPLLEAVTGFFQEMAALADTVRSIAGFAPYVSPVYLAHNRTAVRTNYNCRFSLVSWPPPCPTLEAIRSLNQRWCGGASLRISID